jgi:DNA recombination protein RmuC
MEIVLLLSGLALGFVTGWFFAARKAVPASSGLEAELRGQLAEKSAALDKALEQEKALIAERSRAQADLEAARRLLQEQKAFHEQSVAGMREAFKALSADTLKESAPAFVRLAADQFAKLQEAAKGDLSQRQEAIAGLLKPLEAQLKTYQERLQQSETTQSTVLGKVSEQLASLTQHSLSLAQETERFRMVLKSNQSRGRWGEETLRRVVEAAGMSPYCDFVEQAAGEDTRPDMIVRLPGDRVIVIDSKVPDLEFLATLESSDLETRKLALKAHSDKLKDTIKQLADRDYPAKHPNSLDYVVLFLPAESLFSTALEGDGELIVWAARRKVMLATPASLIGLLRSISLSWDQQKQTENSRKIAEAARELYARVATFTGHFEAIRDGLEKANNAFNKAAGSYERMVRPSGQRLLELGVPSDGKEMGDPAQIDIPLRRIES